MGTSRDAGNRDIGRRTTCTGHYERSGTVHSRRAEPRDDPCYQRPVIGYEDLTGMQPNAEEPEAFVSVGGECVFNWTNKAGYPVGVLVSYSWKDGKFWTTCAARQARVPALPGSASTESRSSTQWH